MYSNYLSIFGLTIIGCISGFPTDNSGSVPHITSDVFVFELPGSGSDLYNGQTIQSYGKSSINGRSLPVIDAQETDNSNGNHFSKIVDPFNKPQDAIVYPDEITRDSYGNPVTPYVPLAPKVQQRDGDVGLLTNVNKNSQPKVPGTSHQDSLTFVLPSYASGITKLNGPYKEPLNTNSGVKHSNQSQPPSSANVNEHIPVKSGVVEYAVGDNSAQNEITAFFPVSPGQSISEANPVQTNAHIGADTDKNKLHFLPAIYPKPNINLSPPNYHPLSESALPDQSNLSSYPNLEVLLPPTQSQPIPFANQKHPISTGINQASTFTQISIPVPNTAAISQNADDGKYTGGFGGASGLLGNQHKPGYAVKPDGSVSEPSEHKTDNSHNDHHEQPAITLPVLSKPQPQIEAISSLPIHQNANNYANDRYNGGFGGPPGILVPYDNYKAKISEPAPLSS